MKKLSIKQKQEIYEYLLKKDCPDLLAALVAERSTDTLQHQLENNYHGFGLELSDFILGAFYWDESAEGHDFWSELRLEIFNTEKGVPEEDFESPTEADFAPMGDDSAKIEILVDTSSFEEGLKKFQEEFKQEVQPSFWTKVKLFFGKWNYKV